MDVERAEEVALEYHRAARGEWPEDLVRASADFLPQTENWAIQYEPEKGHSVVAADGAALYKLVLASPNGVDVSRLPVAGEVSVEERVVSEDSFSLRQRTWSFTLEGNGELALATEEVLGDPDRAPLERVARALACAAGWRSLATGDGRE